MAAEMVVLQRLASDPVHPHVVSLLDELVGGASTILVLTHAGAHELLDYIMDNGALVDAQMRPLAAQLVSGLRHMHSLGVCHADIKLENIMIDAAGSTVKLIDYNLGIVAEPQPPRHLPIFNYHAQGARGSKSYAAPEVLAGLPYDPRLADVWSLGASLFAMCAGFFPFDVATAADWRFTAVQAGQGQPNYSTTRAVFAFYARNADDTIPAGLIDLIDAMLTVSPQARLSLDAVAASPWLAPEAALMNVHEALIPRDPALWRLRARPHWRRLRPHAWLVQRMARALIECYEEVSLRPGNQGMVAAQADFDAHAAEQNAMAYRSLSTGSPPVYRGEGAEGWMPSTMAPEEYLALAAKALGDRLPTPEERKPPPLGRQPAQCPLVVQA